MCFRLDNPAYPRLALLASFLLIASCSESSTEPPPVDVLAQLAKGGGKGKPGSDESAYTLTDLGPGRAGGVSGAGVVVGAVGNDATLWKLDGTPVPLGNVGAPTANAFAINAFGTRAAGVQSDAQGRQQAVRWELDGETVLSGSVLQPVDGFTEGSAYDVNDMGQSVGSSERYGPFTMRATLWEADGTPRDLGTLPGGGAAWAIGINNSGHVVGKSFPIDFIPERPHAVLWIVDAANVTIIDLTPDSDDSGDNQAEAVTEVSNGVIKIAGFSALGGESFATIWTVDVQARIVTDVLRQGGLNDSPADINNNDEVALNPASVWNLMTNSVESLPRLSNRCGGTSGGINDAGTVVGWSGARARGQCTDHAVIWTKNEP